MQAQPTDTHAPMQERPVHTATDIPPDEGALSRWSDSLLWFYLSLALGLAATAAVFAHYVAADAAALRAQLQRGVDSLATFAAQPIPIEAIQRMVDSVVGVQTELQAGAELSEDLLRQHLPSNPAALGFAGIELSYLPRVAAGATDAYAAQFAASERAGLPIVEADGSGGVRPAAERAEYFPVLLSAATSAPFLPLTGLDSTGDVMHRLAMRQARDSGLVVVLTTFPVDEEEPDPLVTRYYAPVYSSRTDPATLEERRAAFSGLVAATAYQDSAGLFTLLAPTMQGIQAAYFPESPLLQVDTDYAEQRALIASGEVATAGYVVPGLGLRFTVAGRANPVLAELLATSTRWWVLSIGLLLTTWFASMALWFRNQSKRIKGLVTARTRELTERTSALAAANSALRESESRYRMLADNATDVIYTCDLEGRYTYVSPSVEMQRGFKPEDLVGKSIADQLPEEEKLRVRARYLEAQAAGRDNAAHHGPRAANKVEFQGYCKDGTLRWLETTVSLLYDASGRFTGMLGVTRDISERKRAEQEKEQLEEAYRQAQKMEAIGTLAGGIAHDFNNLLTGIYGYADILKSQVGANPAAHQSIDIIEKAATRARDLTTQLLGFARKGRMEAVSVDLNESVREVIALLRRTIDPNVTIQHRLSDRAPTVLGDSGQLAHLLLNLGINARDAMLDGGTLTFSVTIEILDAAFCRAHTELSPGSYCHIAVSDTGMGMDKEKMARIFEPFFTDKARGKGTGLGLAMVYGVTRSHGGIVTVDSEPGQGSTFHVYLPYRPND